MHAHDMHIVIQLFLTQRDDNSKMCPKNNKFVFNKKCFTLIPFLNINPSSLKHKVPTILASCYLFDLSSGQYPLATFLQPHWSQLFLELTRCAPTSRILPLFSFLEASPPDRCTGPSLRMLFKLTPLLILPDLLNLIAYITTSHVVLFAYIRFSCLRKYKLHREKMLSVLFTGSVYTAGSKNNVWQQLKTNNYVLSK